MKINSDLVLSLRKEKSYSQDELARLSGLTLRTIQRIEKEGVASLHSKKALAKALDIDVNKLTREEGGMLSKLKGKRVYIVLGAGASCETITGEIFDVEDNWIIIKKKNKTEYAQIHMISKITVAE